MSSCERETGLLGKVKVVDKNINFIKMWGLVWPRKAEARGEGGVYRPLLFRDCAASLSVFLY